MPITPERKAKLKLDEHGDQLPPAAVPVWAEPERVAKRRGAVWWPHLAFRTVEAGDVPFLGKTYVLSSWDECDWHRMVRKAVHTARTNTHFTHLMTHGRALLAVYAAKPSHIAGFILYESTETHPMVHYVWVNSALRKAGLGHELLYQALWPDIESRGGEWASLVPCTHMSNAFRSLSQLDGNRFYLDPWMAYDRMLLSKLKGGSL